MSQTLKPESTSQTPPPLSATPSSTSTSTSSTATTITLSNDSLPDGLPRRAIPGQLLCSSNEYTAGPGTYVDAKMTVGKNSAIVASVLGKVVVTRALSKAESAGDSRNSSSSNGSSNGINSNGNGNGSRAPAGPYTTRTISVVRPEKAADAANAVPAVDDVVLARVLRINPRMANVAILAAGDGNATDEYGGIIRSTDVRLTEKDKVKMSSSFRPGDIIRALVISLGDGTNYYLSTARNDLGVVFATNEASGEPMYPVDWRTMKCPVTGGTEERKCAKPV
ncbi:hypothetical protein BZA70DRAFT_281951 [Myxozyma melibiosi]|uniref:Exosome complex component CSL4 C-terminal domain-containing protein n=1 Tax=Myxozyma melibiosi TaxID=54550 RepID=A0ABR1F1M0_9ASCO